MSVLEEISQARADLVRKTSEELSLNGESMMKITCTAAFPLLACLLAACGGGSESAVDGGLGTLNLEVTDAPFDWGTVEEAVVSIEKVRIHREADGESGFVTLYDGDPVECDLAALRNGLTRGLSSGKLETGTYRQIRLHLAAGRLRLKGGGEYTTEDGGLRFTSHDTSGLKVILHPAVEVVEGEETNVLLDFNMPKSFSPVPGNDIQNARFFHLHPQIRASVRSESGEVSGVVRTDDGGGVIDQLADATLHLLPPGEVDSDQSIATTFSESDGSAVFLGVPPGTYDLLVTSGDRSERLDSVTVSAGATTSFDITLP